MHVAASNLATAMRQLPQTPISAEKSSAEYNGSTNNLGMSLLLFFSICPALCYPHPLSLSYYTSSSLLFPCAQWFETRKGKFRMQTLVIRWAAAQGQSNDVCSFSYGGSYSILGRHLNIKQVRLQLVLPLCPCLKRQISSAVH